MKEQTKHCSYANRVECKKCDIIFCDICKEVEKLTPKNRLFCEYYASDREMFANGVASYMEAYDLEPTKQNYNTAKANAYKLLTKAYILNYINDILDLRGLNDAFVDKQLEFMITQSADMKVKLGAAKEYNVLKSRIKQKLEITTPEGFGFHIEDDETREAIKEALRKNMHKRIMDKAKDKK